MVDERRRRVWPWAVGRAAVVVAAGAVGYVLVVPQHHVVPARVDELVPTRTGVAAFPGAPAQRSPKSVASAGLPALAAAGKAHPDQTGLAVAQWAPAQGGSSSTAGLVAVAFLTPSSDVAGKVATEVGDQALAASTYTAAGLSRSATFDVAGIAGSQGAVFTSSAGATGPGSVATAVFRIGRVVGFVDVAEPPSAGDQKAQAAMVQADTVTAVRTVAAHLRLELPGFTLAPTRYPAGATAGWAAGTAVVAAVVGAGPPLRRRRAERREAARQAEAERLIRVGSSTIVRTRRGG